VPIGAQDHGAVAVPVPAASPSRLAQCLDLHEEAREVLSLESM
jgi:hypothetical protein